MVFELFSFCLTLSLPEKQRKLTVDMPIITQVLNINNLRATSAASIKLHTIRKFIKCFSKTFC